MKDLNRFSQFTLSNRIWKVWFELINSMIREINGFQFYQQYMVVNRTKCLLEVNQYHPSHYTLIETLQILSRKNIRHESVECFFFSKSWLIVVQNIIHGWKLLVCSWMIFSMILEINEATTLACNLNGWFWNLFLHKGFNFATLQESGKLPFRFW